MEQPRHGQPQKPNTIFLAESRGDLFPTEVDSSWSAAGDDYTRGFLWTYQKYDWKGRVVRKINTDGIDQTTVNDSDTLISYDGCGCAGGQVTTIQGENIVETDYQGNNAVKKVEEQKRYMKMFWAERSKRRTLPVGRYIIVHDNRKDIQPARSGNACKGHRQYVDGEPANPSGLDDELRRTRSFFRSSSTRTDPVK